MWCNFVDVKRKQGFLEYKHAALNIWKAVLLLDWPELCLARGFSVDPAGVGPTELVCFRLLRSLCLTCFTCWQNDLFGSEEVVFWTRPGCSYLAVLSLFFLAWFWVVAILCCCIGWIPGALTVPAECNNIPQLSQPSPSHVGDVCVALVTLTGRFITHYTFTLKHIHSGWTDADSTCWYM